MPRRGGCCTKWLRLSTDNARFLLLAIFLAVYLVLGAVLFMFMESSLEQESRANYKIEFQKFLDLYPDINITDLKALLQMHSDAYVAGILEDRRQRWDFAGSFYFVGTVVSTIGFGMTTPRTVGGRIAVIVYGFLGCSGAILFFNLFLERIISFWALILRQIHELKSRRKSQDEKVAQQFRRDSNMTLDDDSLDQWKPSVYKVQFLLFGTSCIIALLASALYHPMEKWDFFDAIYFCFVSFATIGFGDYVASQNAHYPNVHLYRFANFLFLVLGCCCIYSFFNVTSLVIRTFLDWVITKLDIDFSSLCANACDCLHPTHPVPPITAMNRARRNAIDANRMTALANGRKRGGATSKKDSADSTYDSDEEANLNSTASDELTYMQEFFQTNKFALAMMQKQLWETSQQASASQANQGISGGVGPLAIVNQKFHQGKCNWTMEIQFLPIIVSLIEFKFK